MGVTHFAATVNAETTTWKPPVAHLTAILSGIYLNGASGSMLVRNSKLAEIRIYGSTLEKMPQELLMSTLKRISWPLRPFPSRMFYSRTQTSLVSQLKLLLFSVAKGFPASVSVLMLLPFSLFAQIDQACEALSKCLRASFNITARAHLL